MDHYCSSSAYPIGVSFKDSANGLCDQPINANRLLLLGLPKIRPVKELCINCIKCSAEQPVDHKSNHYAQDIHLVPTSTRIRCNPPGSVHFNTGVVF